MWTGSRRRIDFCQRLCGRTVVRPSRTALLTGRTAAHFAPLQKDANGRGTRFNPTVTRCSRRRLRHLCAGKCTSGRWRDLVFQQADARRSAGDGKSGADAVASRLRCLSLGYSFGLNPYFPHQIETGDRDEIPLPENSGVDDDYMSKNYRSSKC